MRAAATALMALALVTAGIALPVAAQSDSGPADQLLPRDEDGIDWSETARGLLAAAEGRVAALTDTVRSAVGTDDAPGVGESRAALQETIDQNSVTLVDYANGRIAPSDDYDTVAITFKDDGESATLYVLAAHNGSEWTSLSTTTSTDRTVDESITLADDAAENAADELQTALDTFISADEQPDAEFVGRATGRYGGDVSATFMGV